jgi:hypothetical protein
MAIAMDDILLVELYQAIFDPPGEGEDRRSTGH